MGNIRGSFHVAQWNSSIIIKVEGFSTHHNSILFKDFIDEMLEKGNKDFIIDLKNCEGMDSTFIGILAGIVNYNKTNKNIGANFGKSKVTLININKSNKKLLDNLGISNILSIIDECELPKMQMKILEKSNEKEDLLKKIALIKEAHNVLSGMNESNKAKYKQFFELV